MLQISTQIRVLLVVFSTFIVNLFKIDLYEEIFTLAGNSLGFAPNREIQFSLLLTNHFQKCLFGSSLFSCLFRASCSLPQSAVFEPDFSCESVGVTVDQTSFFNAIFGKNFVVS